MNWQDEINENNAKRRLNILKGFKESDDALEKGKKGISKYTVGQVNPNNSDQVWTEYKSGKFDWRRADNAKMHAQDVIDDKKSLAIKKEMKSMKLPEGFKLLKSKDFYYGTGNGPTDSEVVEETYKNVKFTPEQAKVAVKYLNLVRQYGKLNGQSHHASNRIYAQEKYFEKIANK